MSDNTLDVAWVPLDRLFCNPANPRLNDPAVPHVAASLKRFGWRQPIMAKPSGEVIAGNTRLKAAHQLGMTSVPVVWFEGSDLDATVLRLARNALPDLPVGKAFSCLVHEPGRRQPTRLCHVTRSRLPDNGRGPDPFDNARFLTRSLADSVISTRRTLFRHLDEAGLGPVPGLALWTGTAGRKTRSKESSYRCQAGRGLLPVSRIN
jgi:hypothetical protein